MNARTSFTQVTHLKGSSVPLEFNEERELIKRFQGGDNVAGSKLTHHYMNWIVAYSWKYRASKVDESELIGAALEGFSMALNKFDVSSDNGLSTYARWWMRSEIEKSVLKNSHIVKRPGTLRHKDLFYKLRKAERSMLLQHPQLEGYELDQKLAEHFEVDIEDVIDARILSVSVTSMNAPVGDESTSEFGDLIPDQAITSPEEALLINDSRQTSRRLLKSSFEAAKLKPREIDILTRRRLQDPAPTLEELSQEYGITRERVRQIEVRAFEKVQAATRRLAQDRGLNSKLILA